MKSQNFLRLIPSLGGIVGHSFTSFLYASATENGFPNLSFKIFLASEYASALSNVTSPLIAFLASPAVYFPGRTVAVRRCRVFFQLWYQTTCARSDNGLDLL